MNDDLYALMTQSGPTRGMWAARGVLRGASWLYGLAVVLREGLYRLRILPVRRLPRPVISVGNITWGGTGKTPLVRELAERLIARGLRPAILTRGYMAGGAVHDGIVSDEAALLSEGLPHVPVAVGGARHAAGMRVLEHYPVDVFLLDDGFQHRQLARDLDVVVVDATRPFGNGCLIPRGSLREPVRCLSRAGGFVLTKTDRCDRSHLDGLRRKLEAVRPGAPIAETVHVPQGWRAVFGGDASGEPALAEQEVCALCSIADPESFRHTLEGCGVHVGRLFAFRDHHRYTAGDIEEVAAFCRAAGIRHAVTTHKDAVKLKELAAGFHGGPDLWCLDIRIKFVRGEQEFYDRVFGLL